MCFCSGFPTPNLTFILDIRFSGVAVMFTFLPTSFQKWCCIHLRILNDKNPLLSDHIFIRHFPASTFTRDGKLSAMTIFCCKNNNISDHQVGLKYVCMHLTNQCFDRFLLFLLHIHIWQWDHNLETKNCPKSLKFFQSFNFFNVKTLLKLWIMQH